MIWIKIQGGTYEKSNDLIVGHSDDLSQKDFGGRNFTVVTNDGYGTYYLVAEEQTGEGVNDAVYARNLAVEERYNATVAEMLGGSHRECATMVANTITAGDGDAFDLIQFHVVSNSGNAMKGLYMNWYDVPYVNFEKPWWSDSIINDLTIDHRTFLAMGDCIDYHCWNLLYVLRQRGSGQLSA